MIINLISLMVLFKANEGQAFNFQDFAMPKIDETLAAAVSGAEPRNNITGFIGLADNLVVLNKTVIGNGVGIILAAAFAAGTLIYTLDENSATFASAKDSFAETFSLNSILARADVDDEKQSKKSKAKKAKGCDCEAYCSNKYYFGDGNWDASDTYASYATQNRRKRQDGCCALLSSKKGHVLWSLSTLAPVSKVNMITSSLFRNCNFI